MYVILYRICTFRIIQYYFISTVSVYRFMIKVLIMQDSKHIYIFNAQGSVWRYGKSGCTMLAFSSTFFMFGALFALFILALDRYLAVVHQR